MSFTLKSENTSTLHNHWTTSVFILSMQLLFILIQMWMLFTAKHSHNQINTTKNTETTSKNTTTQTPQTVRAATNRDEKKAMLAKTEQELMFTAYKKSFIHIFYIFFYWTITCLTEKCYSLIKPHTAAVISLGSSVSLKFLPILLGEISVRLDGNVWQTSVSEFLLQMLSWTALWDSTDQDTNLSGFKILLSKGRSHQGW